MGEAPLISVIVPVYNVEHFLKRCVDSIRSQTYKNLEIILIDDGSTDSSGILCDNYQALDNRIRVIHKPNGGVSSARNAGLDVCTGEYIAFVDSDDYIDADYLTMLYIAIGDANYAACGFKYVDLDGTYLSKFHPEREIILSGKQTLLQHYSGENAASGMNSVYVWGRLYKKELWNQLRFPKNLLFEDIFLMPYILDRCNQVKYLPYYGYNYRYNPNSITNNRSAEHQRTCYLDSFFIWENHLDFYRSHELEQLTIAVECLKADKILNHALADTIPSDLRAYSLNIYRRSVWNLLRKKIPATVKMRYLAFLLFGKRGYHLLKKLFA